MSTTSSSPDGGPGNAAVDNAGEAEKQLSRCEEMVQYSLQRCPKVKFMREKLEKLGCEMPTGMFACRPCEGMDISGGFIPPTKGADGKPSRAEVVLCSDKGVNQTMMDHTMAHELIHAYDQCRVKLDRTNCLHVACTEIRASNTSGECSFNMEVRRGHLKWGGQQKECVKRRAELSVKATPGCSDKAAEYVNSAFKPCYYDTEPYDKNPL
ncbi:conserved unknown protein [Ectocarpus siliculosus]|uniref:Mitochondrial inner membrane protease ATP23 n=1 Tax=Ectocarpus siliculosus TaxID=2880 RepID=D8LT69_ECTSI|nr:conserved unknown protein [Ectocarpus siliculosus]|eukprot:CBN77940.1 conserved unknown protein [Ectocarpus siliculosus]